MSGFQEHGMKCDTAILGRVVGLLLAILTPGVACATDAQLVGDTHISSSHPSVNFGGLTNLHVGNGNTVLIQFDVQAVLPAGILSSQIAKADLVLYVNRVNNPGSLDLKAVTSQWSESAVTSKDRKSTRLNSSHQIISYAVFCLKKTKADDA